MATDNPIRPLVLDTEDFMQAIDRLLDARAAMDSRIRRGLSYADEVTMMKVARREANEKLDNLLTDRVNAALAAKGIQ